MREILFRGKRTSNGEWIDGYMYEHEPPLQGIVPENYIPESSKWYILQTSFADWNMPRSVEFIEVNLDTICQYTGLEDKYGRRIFEGDIVEGGDFNAEDGYGVIKWDDDGARFIIDGAGIIVDFDNYYGYELEIIGNIYDNPELLEESGE